MTRHADNAFVSQTLIALVFWFVSAIHRGLPFFTRYQLGQGV